MLRTILIVLIVAVLLLIAYSLISKKEHLDGSTAPDSTVATTDPTATVPDSNGAGSESSEEDNDIYAKGLCNITQQDYNRQYHDLINNLTISDPAEGINAASTVDQIAQAVQNASTSLNTAYGSITKLNNTLRDECTLPSKEYVIYATNKKRYNALAGAMGKMVSWAKIRDSFEKLKIYQNNANRSLQILKNAKAKRANNSFIIMKPVESYAIGNWTMRAEYKKQYGSYGSALGTYKNKRNKYNNTVNAIKGSVNPNVPDNITNDLLSAYDTLKEKQFNVNDSNPAIKVILGKQTGIHGPRIEDTDMPKQPQPQITNPPSIIDPPTLIITPPKVITPKK